MKPRRPLAETIEEVEFLVDGGMTNAEAVADRLDMTTKGLYQALYRQSRRGDTKADTLRLRIFSTKARPPRRIMEVLG